MDGKSVRHHAGGGGGGKNIPCQLEKSARYYLMRTPSEYPLVINKHYKWRRGGNSEEFNITRIASQLNISQCFFFCLFFFLKIKNMAPVN